MNVCNVLQDSYYIALSKERLQQKHLYIQGGPQRLWWSFLKWPDGCGGVVQTKKSWETGVICECDGLTTMLRIVRVMIIIMQFHGDLWQWWWWFWSRQKVHIFMAIKKKLKIVIWMNTVMKMTINIAIATDPGYWILNSRYLN